MSYRIEVEIDQHLKCSISKAEIERVVATTLESERVTGGAAVWIRLTDDKVLAELNAAYRGIEGTTDVLSFPTMGDQDWLSSPDAPVELGDVIISWPRVIDQAAEEGHSAMNELSLLLVHGCLHLLGHDHLTPSDKERMWARQDAILAALGISIKID